MDIIAWACVTSLDKTYFSAFCLLLNILGILIFANTRNICDISKIILSQNWLFLVVYFLTVFLFAEWSFMFFYIKIE